MPSLSEFFARFFNPQSKIENHPVPGFSQGQSSIALTIDLRDATVISDKYCHCDPLFGYRVASSIDEV
jgi:hypothetical protein